MHCPFCHSTAHKVVDKRSVQGVGEIRRRRECLKCQKRFTTYEKIAALELTVTKRDGRHEPFYKEKLRIGIAKALEKGPMEGRVNEIVERISGKLFKRGNKKVASKIIGKMVLTELKKTDMVAYLRFASVYRQFQGPEDFAKEVSSLTD